MHLLVRGGFKEFQELYWRCFGVFGSVPEALLGGKGFQGRGFSAEFKGVKSGFRGFSGALKGVLETIQGAEWYFKEKG